MKAVTKFYSNGKEVDVMASVKATIEASNESFTAQEIFDALVEANPTDEDINLRIVERTVRGLSTIEANLVDDLGNGQYIRKGVEVVAEASEEVAAVEPVEEVSEPAWTPADGLKVRAAALKNPSIINERPIKWDDLTSETQDLLSR